MITTDPYCVTTSWDNLCYRAYNCCLGNFGCFDATACNYDPALCPDNSLCVYPQYYIPVAFGIGPVVLACERPTDYILANQLCLEGLIENDPYCLNNIWDSICLSSYECCLNEGCIDSAASNYLPSACTNDGSCVFEGNSCPGGFHGDAQITSTDLTAFLAVFGTNCND